MGPTISRFLKYPVTQEREILAEEIPQEARQNAASAQISFLNGLAGDLDARVVHISKNTDQKLIVVTQDKMLLTLKKNMSNLGKKEWLAPLSTVTTILLALITSNFRFALGLGPEEWRAIFIVSGLISCGWLAYSVRKSMAAKGFNDVVADIVHELGNHRKATL
ncbi:hypothetical protein FJZ28_00380 [Candidatus Peregrinibacteria bacterium]|nr:hypothetical protein [Candidatus Peregrinibacteria bacterium]